MRKLHEACKALEQYIYIALHEHENQEQDLKKYIFKKYETDN
jgi:hypothetical protein